MRRPILSGSLALLGALTGFQTQLFAQATAPPTPGAHAATVHTLNVTVVSGRNGANILRPGLAALPVVEVRDAQNHPIVGALVRFTTPTDGATVTFPDGSHAFSVVSDPSGRATLESMQPSGVGSFTIEVSAGFNGLYGEATIPQSNFATLRAASASGATLNASRTKVANVHTLSTPVKVGLLAGGIAIAAAVGIYFATRKSNSSSIGVGTPTVGAPE